MGFLGGERQKKEFRVALLTCLKVYNSKTSKLGH